jgi:4-hydroxythreonine-4-phosphate dehydrogenase
MSTQRRPLALTMGDPAGIAGEIVIKAWHAPDGRPVPPFALIGDPEWLRAEAHHMKSHTRIIEIASMDDAARRFADGVPVLPLRLAERARHGEGNSKNAGAVVESIRSATAMALKGDALGVVTNPIHKASLYASGFAFPGHTEFLASLTHAEHPVMMLVIEGLRVVPVTVHLSLAKAIEALSVEGIVAKARVTHHALRQDFNIASPRLAVAALNPHAGENGAMGDEEQRLIAPAVARLVAEGIHKAARQRYDAAICMYHDQALIPLKTLDFDRGVNVTLGLPFARTSPDHGTAFDIAGQGRASADSLVAALRLAEQIGLRRNGHA